MGKNILTKGNKIAVIAIALTLLITTVGVSFAAFYTRTPQTGLEVVNTTCFDTEYTESSSMVNLAYTVPISNEEGLVSTPLSFTIKNKCDISEKYYVILNTKSSDKNISNMIDEQYINLSLNGGIPKSVSTYRNANQIDYTNSDYNNSYIIAEGRLEKDDTATFNIRTWLQEAVTYEQVQGKNWQSKITIYTITEQPIFQKIKASAQPSTGFYSGIGGSNEISSVTDDNFSKDQETYTVDTTHQSYYITYANSYTFNSPTTSASGDNFPSYTLASVQVAKYSDIYGSLAGKYIVNYEGHNSSTAARSATIDRIYKVVSATADSITYIPSSYTIEFTNNGTTGVYTAEDENNTTSYYFRGNVTDNYVKFGKWTEEVYRGYNSDQSGYKEYFTQTECQADGTYNYDCNKSPVSGKDMYWRIVRINGDGTLRLMYDGTEAHVNGTKSLDRFALPYQQYNTSYDNNAYIGYMYGDTAGATYEEVHANTNDSTIKTTLEKWYEKNFVGTEYASKIGDMSFCNDRSLVNGTGVGTTQTFYGAYGRLEINKSPTLVCPQKSDLFTKNDTEKGNGKLTYPVGLLTADETALAGGVYNYYFMYNRGYYINKGYTFWLGSPYSYDSIANGFRVGNNGNMYNYYVHSTYGVVPVINLSVEYANQLVGNGTREVPYEFSNAIPKGYYQITFDSNYNPEYPASVDVKTKIVKEGEPYGALPYANPTRYGKFYGWFTEKYGAGEQITSSTIVSSSASNQTLYAYVDSFMIPE